MDNFDLKKYLKEGFLDHPSERESKRDFKNQFPKSKGFAGEPGVTSASRSQDFGHPDNIISVVDDMTLTMGEDAFIAAIFKALSLEDAKRVLRVITNDNPIENELGPVTYDWLKEDINYDVFDEEEEFEDQPIDVYSMAAPLESALTDRGLEDLDELSMEDFLSFVKYLEEYVSNEIPSEFFALEPHEQVKILFQAQMYI